MHDCTAAAARSLPWHDPGVSVLGIHHVGIAVRDLEVARARYERLLGARNGSCFRRGFPGHGSDEPVPALGQSLEVARLIGLILQRFA